MTSYTTTNQISGRRWSYLGAGEGTEPPPSDLLGPAVLTGGPGPGPGPRAAGTAALRWRGQPLWGSGESTPHQTLCSPAEYKLGQVLWFHWSKNDPGQTRLMWVSAVSMVTLIRSDLLKQGHRHPLPCRADWLTPGERKQKLPDCQTERGPAPFL